MEVVNLQMHISVRKPKCTLSRHLIPFHLENSILDGGIIDDEVQYRLKDCSSMKFEDKALEMIKLIMINFFRRLFIGFSVFQCKFSLNRMNCF